MQIYPGNHQAFLQHHQDQQRGGSLLYMLLEMISIQLLQSLRRQLEQAHRIFHKQPLL